MGAKEEEEASRVAAARMVVDDLTGRIRMSSGLPRRTKDNEVVSFNGGREEGRKETDLELQGIGSLVFNTSFEGVERGREVSIVELPAPLEEGRRIPDIESSREGVAVG